jgi:hypothetical protein
VAKVNVHVPDARYVTTALRTLQIDGVLVVTVTAGPEVTTTGVYVCPIAPGVGGATEIVDGEVTTVSVKLHTPVCPCPSVSVPATEYTPGVSEDGALIAPLEFTVNALPVNEVKVTALSFPLVAMVPLKGVPALTLAEEFPWVMGPPLTGAEVTVKV